MKVTNLNEYRARKEAREENAICGDLIDRIFRRLRIEDMKRALRDCPVERTSERMWKLVRDDGPDAA